MPDIRRLKAPISSRVQRLDVVLTGLLAPEISRAGVQRLIKEGKVSLAGAEAKASAKLAGGESIRVEIPDPQPVDLIPEPMELAVLFEDEHLIVVNKPPGLVVHPAPGHPTGTLVHGLLAHTGGLAQVGGKLRPGIVHRLDQDTSGALVATKSDGAHRGLVTAFAAGRVQKEYLALVWGRPAAQGKSESGIGRHPVDRKRMSVTSRHAKPAKSRWRLTRAFGCGLSLVRVAIATGRTHQIRVHMAEAGHPVVNDGLYGGRRGRQARLGAVLPDAVARAVGQSGRQLLHAAHLAFDHPVSKQRLTIDAPLPQDFRLVLGICLEDDIHREKTGQIP